MRVSLDFAGLALSCEDDGCGVPLADAPLLGEPCYSSRAAELGWHGLALSRLAQLCILQLITRAAGEFDSHAKCWRGGVVVSCGLALEPLSTSGTIVHVQECVKPPAHGERS